MALVIAKPAVMAGALGHAGGCCNFGTWKAGPLSVPPVAHDTPMQRGRYIRKSSSRDAYCMSRCE
jgi:hypothetical protein